MRILLTGTACGTISPDIRLWAPECTVLPGGAAQSDIEQFAFGSPDGGRVIVHIPESAAEAAAGTALCCTWVPVVVILPEWSDDLADALMTAGVEDVLAVEDGFAEDGGGLYRACRKACKRAGRSGLLPSVSAQTLLQTILDAAPEPIFAKDASGRYVLANLACCRVMGRERDQVIGRRDRELFPADVTALVERVDNEVLQGACSHSYEERIPTPAGERIYSTVKAPVLSQAAGVTVVGLVGVAKDITRRAHALQELEERTRLLALAEDVAHVGHFRIRFRDRQVHWSPVCYGLSGVMPHDFTPTVRNHLQAVHPADRQLLRQARRVAFRHGIEVSQDVRLILPDGLCRTAMVRLLPERDPLSGSYCALFGVVFDTTDIRVARQEAEEKQELLNMAVSSITDGLVLYDEDDRLVLCNDSYCRMYELPADLARPGTSFEELLRYSTSRDTAMTDPSEKVQWFADRITLHQVGGSVEQRFGDRWYLVNESRLPNGFRVGTRVDITNLKEAQLEATAASRAKSEFLSNMSHELRTPLNAVLGFAQLMLSSSRDPLTDRQRRSVHHILQAGEHLLTLITEILDLTRIEAGKLVLVPQGVDLGELTRDCVALTDSLARKHQVQVTFEGAGREEMIWADPTRTRQVVLNLLSNAVKYNRPGGFVRIRVRPQAEPRRLVLEVEDSGRGIPLSRQAVLFEPFARLGLEDSGIEGTGIGLTISARLMREMGGEIAFSSTEGVGSVFRADFPLAPAG